MPPGRASSSQLSPQPLELLAVSPDQPGLSADQEVLAVGRGGAAGPVETARQQARAIEDRELVVLALTAQGLTTRVENSVLLLLSRVQGT